MAVVTELCCLLFALITNIHAEEQLDHMYSKMDHHMFWPDNNASLCLISRFVGEEKLVLWNISTVWSESSTLPDDLKRRLLVRSFQNFSYYEISNLTHSDSGLYQEECWTDGNMLYQENISFVVCGSRDWISMPSYLGKTVDLLCDTATDNLTVKWFKKDYEQRSWVRLFEDSLTSEMDDVNVKLHVVKNTSALRVFNITETDFGEFFCLMMNQQQCVRGHFVSLKPSDEVMYFSVGERAVLQCPVSDQFIYWFKYNSNGTSRQMNSSLIFPSLTLNDSGFYICEFKVGKVFELIVCPKFDPPTVKLFSEGDNITLKCRDSWREHREKYWFRKSNKTGGRILHSYTNTSIMFVSKGNLVITNVSSEDTGEYWCAVTGPNYECLSTSKYVMLYAGFYSTFYVVRCSVLSCLLLILCVTVAAVNHRTNGRQLPAHA